MTRKDCESSQRKSNAMLRPRSARAARGSCERTCSSGVGASVSFVLVTWLFVFADEVSRADSVRVWPTAVVVADTIVVSDVCQLRGLEPSLSEALARAVIAESPIEGGTRIIDVRMIRAALAAAGGNLSTLIVSGARECVVSRPGPETALNTITAMTPPITRERGPRDPASDFEGGQIMVATPLDDMLKQRAAPGASHPGMAYAGPSVRSLRGTVIEFFKKEFGQFGDSVDVEFDRTAGAAVDLAGDEFEFVVRRKPGSRMETTQVEVDVVREGRVVQSVSLNVRVTLHRQVVTARRPINQGATIRAGDVMLRPMMFQRFENLGFSEESQCVGQRAKRFIAEGAAIDSNSIESVPLVARGQLVTLTSVCGAVRVVSSGRAGREGRLGEVIPVRAADDGKAEFDAVVVGPGKVEIASDPIRVHGPLVER